MSEHADVMHVRFNFLEIRSLSYIPHWGAGGYRVGLQKDKGLEKMSKLEELKIFKIHDLYIFAEYQPTRKTFQNYLMLG
jgi:hypothetical protein